MQELRRLWRALEEIPGLMAVRAEWRRWVADDIRWVEKHLLRPTGELAHVYPSNHGEPYQIVDHGDGHYKAVHPDGAPSIELTTPDVTILRIEITSLVELICPPFGFTVEPVMPLRAGDRLRVGTWAVTTRTTCPVWLCIRQDRSLLHDSLRHLAVEADEPFVVMTPGLIDDASLARTLADHVACYLPLSEAVESISADVLSASPAGKHRLKLFRRAVQTHEAIREPSGQDRGNVTQTTSDDRYAWARQIELVIATNKVLGDGTLNKGVLSRACAGGRIETNGQKGRAARVRMPSFLAWITRQMHLAKSEEDQIRNAVIGEISSRNTPD